MNSSPALRARNVSSVVIILVTVALGLVTFLTDVDQCPHNGCQVDRDEKQSKRKDAPFGK
jgi:hypothetical protein